MDLSILMVDEYNGGKNNGDIMPICDMMRANYRNLRNLRESEFGC